MASKMKAARQVGGKMMQACRTSNRKDDPMSYHLFGGPRSRAFRVIWMLEELGVAYQHTAASARSDEVVAVNPSGKVPVLVSDGTPLTDSTAILTYLADRHGQFTYPPGTIDRARQDGFTQLVNDELDGALWTASRHSFVLPEEHRVPEVKPSLKWEFARSAARLAERLDGPFLMGDEMTVPDFVLAHCLGWSIVAKFDELPPVLRDYLARMQERPAYIRARATA